MTWELTRRRIARAANSKFIFDRIVSLTQPCAFQMQQIFSPGGFSVGPLFFLYRKLKVATNKLHQNSVIAMTQRVPNDAHFFRCS